MTSPRATGGLRSAAVLTLCALFALLSVGLALLSGGVYRSVSAAADRGFSQRTALGYLVNQVRRGDERGGVALASFGGGDALTLTETLDSGTYVTVLYCYDGQLRELYMERGSGLGPADGVAVLPLTALALAEEEGLLRITVTAEGGVSYAAAIAPRCGLGEGIAL